MKAKDRDWFDFVYDSMRSGIDVGDYSVMAFYTSNRDAIAEVRGETYSSNPSLVKRMELAARGVPSARAFRQEKGRVIFESTNKIRDAFPNIEALFYFGRTVGDIDLAGIMKEWDIPTVSRELMKEFPLYDWASFQRLSASCCWNIADKLVYQNSFGRVESVKGILKRSKKAMKGMKLLFGDEKYLGEMRRTVKVYRRIGN